MTQNDLIQACPECGAGSTAIYRRTTHNKQAPGTPDGEWYCRECKQAFDEPHEREREHPANITHGLAATLDALDPDDVSGGDPA